MPRSWTRGVRRMADHSPSTAEEQELGQQAGADTAQDRHLLADLNHERLEVEDHITALGAHVGDVVVEHLHETLMCTLDGLHPDGLHAGPFEALDRQAVGEGAECAGECAPMIHPNNGA